MKIEHIAMWTNDLDRLKKFYETYFIGFSNKKYINHKKQFVPCFLQFDSGARLEVMRKDDVPSTKKGVYEHFTGIIHLAFSVGSK